MQRPVNRYASSWALKDESAQRTRGENPLVYEKNVRTICAKKEEKNMFPEIK